MNRILPVLICLALSVTACGQTPDERSESAIEQHVDEMTDLADSIGEQAEAAAHEAKERTDRALEEAERGD